MLLKWALQQGLAVIPKSVNQVRIAEFGPQQFEGWSISEDDMIAIDMMNDGHKFCWDPSCIR